MIFSAKSENLQICADSAGAELHSIEFNGKQYLWQCKESWKRYAPILFPFICSPKDRKYKAGGNWYKMDANHGFARDCQFQPGEMTENSISFILQENEQTLKQYPYKFKLTVSYTAEKNCVEQVNTVENTDSKPIYFYLGGHPAFNCPLNEDETFEDYYVEFEKNENLKDSKGNVLAKNGKTLNISRPLFDNDAIITDSPNSKEISLKSRKSSRYVKVKFPQSNCIAVWSPTGDDDAKFVCLEPWTSVPVYADDSFEDIEKKPHGIKLEPGEIFSCTYIIEVG